MIRIAKLSSVRMGLAAAAALCALVGIVGTQVRSAEADDGLPPTVRRLSEAQYRNTIADVFGPDIKVAGRFEPDLRVDRLLAVGSSSIGISPAGLEQYDSIARSVAEQAMSDANRDRIVPCKPRAAAKFDRACATRFFTAIGVRLYRRPLQSREIASLVEAAGGASATLGGFYPGLRYALASMLVSPHFLYRIEQVDAAGKEGVSLDPYEKAVRLSYFLVNSTPDQELLAAAARGDLDNPVGLQAQVDRLLASPGLERGVRAFFWDVLQLDRFAAMAKDPEIYPAFNPKVAAEAEEQTLRMITDHLIAAKGDYRDLFTTRDTWMTRSLGLVYAVPVQARNGWERYSFEPDSGRAGLLTEISFLALHSHPGRSSPTIRGKALREVFLCQQVPPPPPDVDFTVVQDTTNPTMKTARERLVAHRTQPACQGCHKLMDPLGLALEQYDGAGSFRRTENDAVIDASGSLDGIDFTDAAGLGKALHDSPKVSQCLVNNAYRYAVGRNVASAERAAVKELVGQFANDGYRFTALMRRIALSNSFYRVSRGEPAKATRVKASARTKLSTNGVLEKM